MACSWTMPITWCASRIRYARQLPLASYRQQRRLCIKLSRCSVKLLNRDDPLADYDRNANLRPTALAPVHQNVDKLHCGRSPLSTPYDDLFIRLERLCRQPDARTPDPDAAYMFVRSAEAAQRIQPKILAQRLRRRMLRQHRRLRRHWMSVHSLHLLGNYWRLRGMPLRAMQCFQTALVVRPRSASVLHSTAQLMLHMGRPLDAAQLVAIASAGASGPPSWRHWQTLCAIASRHPARWDATQTLHDCVRQAIRAHPRHAFGWQLNDAVTEQRLELVVDYFASLLQTAVSVVESGSIRSEILTV